MLRATELKIVPQGEVSWMLQKQCGIEYREILLVEYPIYACSTENILIVLPIASESEKIFKINWGEKLI